MSRAANRLNAVVFSSPCRIHLINVAVPVARRPHYLASGRRLSDVMETHSLNFIPKLVIRPETSWDEPRLSYSTPLLRLKLIWFFIDLFLIISPHWWNLTMLRHMTWHMISFYCLINKFPQVIPLIFPSLMMHPAAQQLFISVKLFCGKSFPFKISKIVLE